MLLSQGSKVARSCRRGPEAWTLSTPLQGLNVADDHINLKTESSGRVYGAVKTSRTTSTSPLVYFTLSAVCFP